MKVTLSLKHNTNGHIYSDDDRGFEDVINFVRDVSSYKQHLAVRLPHDLDEDEIHYYLTPVINSLSENCKLYVFLDAGYIRCQRVFI